MMIGTGVPFWRASILTRKKGGTLAGCQSGRNPFPEELRENRLEGSRVVLEKDSMLFFLCLSVEKGKSSLSMILISEVEGERELIACQKGRWRIFGTSGGSTGEYWNIYLNIFGNSFMFEALDMH
ncbi:hypothetical protein JTE90_009492 [Oedothorax gibbosus]|uniref:Uncharacterized protein n=1 Tax=Oedothorax gibbosus TaxID=931172 RepID=A0AAV6USV1_9ARAC|nr:hypothetical protein JTE90_009492 [Oedothorax gibbosus]